jgi:tRNA nucleotidyltransferase/poly(A) polymerase
MTNHLIDPQKVFMVGGAVRDTIMGLKPTDRDWLVIGHTPEQMKSAGFLKVGADFPVFLHPETGEEYALARRERKTGEGYLGFSTDYSTDVTVEEDLARRDLSINSMAMNSSGRIIDPYGGRYDIENRVIRHTSDAFAEDPLRALRAIRFIIKFGFYFDPTTEYLVRRLITDGSLNSLPYERFVKELQKLEGINLQRFLNRVHSYDGFEKLDFFKQFDYQVTHEDTYRHQRFTYEHLFFRYAKLDARFPSEDLLTLRGALMVYRQSGISIDLVKKLSGLHTNKLVNKFIALLDKEIDLQLGVRLCCTVKAADFPHLSGKELGEAMNKKRQQLLDCLD